VAELVRGEDGSRVELSVLRAGVPITFTVTRSQVEVPNLEYSDLGGGVWYMRITRFSDAYTYMLNAQARNDMKNAGAQALVLDLRGNPGGEIRMALTFIDHLIDKDGVKYFTLRDREGDDRELFDNNFLSSGNGLSLNKIVILTDHETASAAEIMTAALHDTGYAVTVGETTFGKARGQNHLVFDDGSAAVLTTVQLVPPSGVDYEGKGLAPDVPVENRREGHPASACRRLSFRRLSMGARGQDVTDLQNAMKALGYLEDWYESDVFDGELLGAVNAFLNTVGENPMTYVNARTAGLINARLDDLSRLHIVRDDQLAKAVEIAGTYVK
jgi:carboxyl-terminal processing protease